MRPKGSGAVLEIRRRLAVQISKVDQPRGKVAEWLGVHRPTLWRWRCAAERGGAEALAARSQPAARPRLSQQQRRRLAEWLSQDPTEHGWPTSLWTGRRVAALIQRQFGLRYHPGYVRRRLRSLGF